MLVRSGATACSQRRHDDGAVGIGLVSGWSGRRRASALVVRRAGRRCGAQRHQACSGGALCFLIPHPVLTHCRILKMQATLIARGAVALLAADDSGTFGGALRLCQSLVAAGWADVVRDAVRGGGKAKRNRAHRPSASNTAWRASRAALASHASSWVKVKNCCCVVRGGVNIVLAERRL